jgi:hypothetical protein
MEQIGISPRFFRHELNAYSYWEKAFWRELVQNAVDAKASTITISLTTNQNGNCVITFSDNGTGMDEATMRNVYFQLGETGKDNADTIGGHGRARILTCFAQEAYQIRTANLLCSGIGGHYSIQNDLPYTKGCTLEIEIHKCSQDRMRSELTRYLQTCQLPCEVFVNNEKFTEWLYRRKATRTLTFGTIHTSKTFSHKVLVRVRGVTMFETWLECSIGIILEIEAAQSRRILTVSRDRLKDEQNQEFQAFLSQATIDSQSLKRDALRNETNVFGKFRRIGKKQHANQEKAEPEHPPEMRTVPGSTLLHGWNNTFSIPTSLPSPDSTLPSPARNDYVLHFEDATSLEIKGSKKFQPETLSGAREKLLEAWDEALQFFLEILSELQDQEFDYMPGFLFCPHLRGGHQKRDEGHLILLNPLSTTGKFTIRANNHALLFAIAAHECTHTVEPYHNEDFASLLTSLTQLGLLKYKEFKSRVQSRTKTSKPK